VTTPAPAPVLLTQEDAARLMRCSTGKLARERRLGNLAYVPGRPVLIRLDDLLDWLDRRRIAAKPKELPPIYDPTRAARRVLRRRNHTNTKRTHAS
jgi:hypothetical protein